MSDSVDITNILSGNEPIPALEKLKALVKELKGELDFGQARKLLEKAKEVNPKEEWIIQQLALCTYKDEELYPKRRFDTALELLKSIDLCDAKNKNTETLALGGAVFKRMWEFGGQLEHLYESLAFYRAAHERNPEEDMGYGGINAAYLLDVIAARAESLEKRSGLASKEAKTFRKEAGQIRKKIRDVLLSKYQEKPEIANHYWFSVTLGEAYFGLGNYEEAAKQLDYALQLEPKEWELQTTFRQWVGQARQQGIELPADIAQPAKWHKAWQTLRHLLEDKLSEETAKATAEALSCYRGVEVPGVRIYKARQKRGLNTRRLKRALKRRNAIEPIIGHLKNDGLLRRNYLKGALGDTMHAILCGVGHNIRLILRRLRIFWPEIWRMLSRFWMPLQGEQVLLSA